MGSTSLIGWTDATWTPIRARHRVTRKVGWHCEHASPGCANCYSEAFNEVRLGTGLPFKPGHRGDVEHFLDEGMLLAPLRWRKPRRIFVCSMTDLFGDWVPNAWIDRVFAVMALAPQHTFQLLTKRAGRMRAYLDCRKRESAVGYAAMDVAPVGRDIRSATLSWTPRVGHDFGGRWPLPNVWLGVSSEDQPRADERIPDLLETPAAVRFVSAEPLLGPMDLKRWMPAGRRAISPSGEPFIAPHYFRTKCEHCGWLGSTELCGTDFGGDDSDVYCPSCHRSICADDFDGRLDLVIVGGESGPDARPMHPGWAQSLRDQCAAAGVAFYFKQWGAWRPNGGPAGCEPIPGVPLRKITDTGADATDLASHGGYPVWMQRTGRRAISRLLDGVEHNGMPEAYAPLSSRTGDPS